MKKKPTLIGLFIAIIVVSTITIIYFANKPEEKSKKSNIDENAIQEDFSDKKMDKTSGGAASISYSNIVQIDEDIINLYVLNPAKSREIMQLDIYVYVNEEEIKVSSTKMIPPGYSIKKTKYDENIEKLKPGKYDGKIIINFYDEESNNLQMVNSKINTKVTVK